MKMRAPFCSDGLSLRSILTASHLTLPHGPSLLAAASQPKIFIPAVLLTCVAIVFDGLFAMLAFWTIGFSISFGTGHTPSAAAGSTPSARQTDIVARSKPLRAPMENSGAALRPAMSGRLARENTGAGRLPHYIFQTRS